MIELPSDNELKMFMLKYRKENGFSRTTMDYAHKWCLENLPLQPLTREGIQAERKHTPKLMEIAHEMRELDYKDARKLLNELDTK